MRDLSLVFIVQKQLINNTITSIRLTVMVNSSILVQSSELCVTLIFLSLYSILSSAQVLRDWYESLAQSILVSCFGMEQAKRHFSIDFSNFCSVCWVFIASECLCLLCFFCTMLRLFCAILFSRVFLFSLISK